MPNSTNDRLIELMAMKSRMLSGGDSDAEVLDGAAENRSGRAASDLIGNVEAIARELSLDVTDVIAGRRSLPSYTKSIEQLRELAAADVSLTNEFNLGLGLGLRSQYEESTEILRRAFSAYPDAPVEMKLYLALILIRARQLDEAKELLTSQIVRYPDLGYAHYLMGLALHVEWNFAECVNYYRGALDLNPNDKLAGHNIVNGLERFLPAELRFIQHRFFKFDGGDDDRACASVLSESLFSSDKTMAIFGISDLTDYLFSVLPNLSKQISCVVSDDSSQIGRAHV